MRPTALAAALALSLGLAMPAAAAAPLPYSFTAIDGGTLPLGDWAGRPVLVANTASLCGFTGQYTDLQALYDRYRDRGLIVLAVPSNDVRQELATAEQVADFCEVNFDLDLPMTDITPVRGRDAHPFYRWLAAEHGFTPRRNFNKVLIAPDGTLAGTWGSNANPMGGEITRAVEALLP